MSDLPIDAKVDDLIKSTNKKYQSIKILCNSDMDEWRFIRCQTEDTFFAMVYHKDNFSGICCETYDIKTHSRHRSIKTSYPGKWAISYHMYLCLWWIQIIIIFLNMLLVNLK